MNQTVERIASLSSSKIEEKSEVVEFLHSDENFSFSRTSGVNASCRAAPLTFEALYTACRTKPSEDNWNANAYYNLFAAVGWMAKLPDDHELHMDEAVADCANRYLAILQNHTKASPPKIMNDCGEAALFTWTMGDVKRYLSVSPEDIGLLEIATKSGVKKSATISTPKEIPIALLANLFGTQDSSSKK